MTVNSARLQRLTRSRRKIAHGAGSKLFRAAASLPPNHRPFVIAEPFATLDHPSGSLPPRWLILI
jgi:hypothetical protein